MRSWTTLGTHSSSGVWTLPHQPAWRSARASVARSACGTVMPSIWSAMVRSPRSSITITKSAVPLTMSARYALGVRVSV